MIAVLFGLHCGLAGAATSSATLSDKSHLYLAAGAYLPSPGYVAIGTDGSTSYVRPLYALVGPRGSIKLPGGQSSRWRFEPAVRLVLPWRKNIDGAQRTYTSILNLDVGFFLNSRLQLKGGAGLQWEYFYGPGGSVTLNNGASTAVYFTPDASRSSWIGAFDLGATCALRGGLRLELDLALWTPMNAARRQYSAALGFGYAVF